MITRRRGTAIVETKKGILLTAGKSKNYLLPGGGARKWESRRKAAIRELKEETSLKTYVWKYLFTYNEPKHYESGKRRKIRNLHKVFLIRAEGNPKPNHHDVSYINYWNKPNLKVSRQTQIIIKRYIKNYKK